MKLFLVLLFSAVIARGTSLGIEFLFPKILTLNPAGNSIDLSSNAIFVFMLALLISFRKREIVYMRSLLAIPIFLLTIVMLAISGMFIGELSFEVGLLMISLVGALGYYPSGADVSFDYGISIWALSALIPIAIGILIGTLGRRFSIRLRRQG